MLKKTIIGKIARWAKEPRPGNTNGTFTIGMLVADNWYNSSPLSLENLNAMRDQYPINAIVEFTYTSVGDNRVFLRNTLTSADGQKKIQQTPKMQPLTEAKEGQRYYGFGKIEHWISRGIQVAGTEDVRMAFKMGNNWYHTEPVSQDQASKLRAQYPDGSAINFEYCKTADNGTIVFIDSIQNEKSKPETKADPQSVKEQLPVTKTQAQIAPSIEPKPEPEPEPESEPEPDSETPAEPKRNMLILNAYEEKKNYIFELREWKEARRIRRNMLIKIADEAIRGEMGTVGKDQFNDHARNVVELAKAIEDEFAKTFNDDPEPPIPGQR